MVDKALLAAKIAAVADAVDRIRTTLPPSVEAFAVDRTAREVVTLNLFVAIQACLDVATHWVADEGWGMPGTYADAFATLAERGITDQGLASRLGAAAAFRNLIAHQYGVLDWRRVYTLASTRLVDLEAFCADLARQAERR